jgi:mono/diheme cytochrome c family protein
MQAANLSRLSTLLAALAITGGWAAAAGAQDVGDVRAGENFAKRVCAECHAVAPGQVVPAAAPPFKAIANTPGMTALALAVFLRTSHRTMPNFVIADEDRDNVIAYILSLRNKR